MAGRGPVFAAAVAWLIGKVSLGLRSDYLAIATLGISEIVIAVLKNEDWLARGVKNVTGLQAARALRNRIAEGAVVHRPRQPFPLGGARRRGRRRGAPGAAQPDADRRIERLREDRLCHRCSPWCC
jgi:hypothetical protein